VTVSQVFWAIGDRQPSFLLALEAVLMVLVSGDGDQGPAAAQRMALVPHVRGLDANQAESLDHMRQHLCVAGAGHLDFSGLERVLALRPLLSLKMSARQQEAPRGGARAPCGTAWREWKAAAAAALDALGAAERICVRNYVWLCIQQQAGELWAAEDGNSTPPEAFPALQAAVRPGRQLQEAQGAPPTQRASCSFEDEQTASRGKRKGKQRQVLVAWG